MYMELNELTPTGTAITYQHVPQTKFVCSESVIINSEMVYRLKACSNLEYSRITLCLKKNRMKDTCLSHLVIIISA